MIDQDKSFFEKLNIWVRNSLTIRLLSIGFMILILLIPASMIESLISERQYRNDDAKREVSAIWGEIQTISGPVLTVPFKKSYVNEKKEIYTQTEYAHFLPENLAIESVIEPEKRHRGIYDVVVYTTDLKFSGKFNKTNFDDWNIPDKDILWKEAYLAVGITDMRGIKNEMKLNFDKNVFPFNPGLENNDVISTGVSTRINISENNEIENEFTFNIKLRGSEELYFIPVGKTTEINMKSIWSNPSFQGAYLPENHNITKDGFDANWKVLHLNRNYPQKWLGSQYQIANSAFGVSLIIPVDHYQKSMRSAKYAIMIISFTFLIFFFVEVLNKKRIHPIQYLLVGLALIIFYALLLAISEHLNFNIAYAISSIATISLITLYSKSIFKDNLQTAITGLTLIILYVFIYITLQLQDYALLMGSIGLFIVMAIVMYLSKKINWYSFASND
ncbi:MAG: cell envelope integrity protein CreD [Bacteroidales bacterium]|nr:cell envelope integrity protein CreD [Bacteroidales bacterium]MBN2758515.1 cell envelope integrity protein CreD [Bacteroidales bacterium]